VELNVDTSRDLANSLDKAVKLDNPFFNTMLRILATRCMLQAIYFASGTKTYDEFLHYGLAAPIYTHFTSPIRRRVPNKKHIYNQIWCNLYIKLTTYFLLYIFMTSKSKVKLVSYYWLTFQVLQM